MIETQDIDAHYAKKFQHWHMEYSKAAMFHREIGETNRAKYFQEQSAEQFKLSWLFRYDTTICGVAE